MFKRVYLLFAILPLLGLCAEKPPEFKTFTGKVLGYKVRMRTRADLDSHIIAQFDKNDLLLVIGEENEFWKIAPPSGMKAYIFRSYVIDDKVEANRVNVRLEPNVNAPIIGQLNEGCTVKGQISPVDHKWMEINPPFDTAFYIAKEFLGYAGPPEHLALTEKRKSEVKDLLNSAYFLTESECKKSFNQMSPQTALSQFEKVIQEYPEFEEYAQQAKEGLALLQENYLQKKIAYLEKKASQGKNSTFVKNEAVEEVPQNAEPTSKMQFWQPVEESLYLTWSAFHPGKKQPEFYAEQKVNALTLSGVLESYAHALKNKPGDYILRNDDSPVAYLYSLHIDLDQYLGKDVTLLLAPRPNHHFAFPAYYVIDVQQ